MKTDISKKKKCIEQTYKLERERRELIKKMTSLLIGHDIDKPLPAHYHALEKRMTNIHRAQCNNALLLADMLAEYIEVKS